MKSGKQAKTHRRGFISATIAGAVVAGFIVTVATNPKLREKMRQMREHCMAMRERCMTMHVRHHEEVRKSQEPTHADAV